MKIFIAGIGGFLGSHLAPALEARGHRVAPIGEAETLVDLAYDFRPGTLERNVAEARRRFDEARGAHRIYVSSHSARPDAVSEYGIAKYRIERFYLEAGETVVRPGLVIGPGGLFGRQLQAIRSARVVPLIDGGHDGVPVLAVADFCAAMVRLTESGRRGEFNLFNQIQPSMRQIVETVSRAENRAARILPVPYGPAALAVRLAENLGARLPFTSESLRTMKLNRSSVHESNLRELLDLETSFEQAIAEAIKGMRRS